MSNVSSNNSNLPPEVKKWNWGAFLLNWIWGLGNRTYIALLCLIPLVNFVMIFVLGTMGGRWAWNNRQWKDVDHFTRVQGLWAAFGFGMLAGCLLMLVIFISLLVVLFNNVFM